MTIPASSRSIWPAPHVPTATELPASADVVIAGAGLTGVTAALLLAEAGLSVVVAEARHVGAVTTGGTTGKLSLLQGTRVSTVAKRAGQEAVSQYIRASRAAQGWVVDRVGDDPAIIQERPAYTYASRASDVSTLQGEHDALQAAGVPVAWVDDVDLPVAAVAALRLPGQYQLHPTRLLERLAREAVAAGAVIVEGCRVTEAHDHDDTVLVETRRGDVRARRLILATGTPILDRGLYFARLEPMREVTIAYHLPAIAADLTGMYLGIGSRTRSVRLADTDEGTVLLVGGESFPTGADTADHLDVLDGWGRDTFGLLDPVTWWGAQDYVPAGSVPFARRLLPRESTILVATGYDKWGMTSGVAAARALAGRILGREHEEFPSQRRYAPVAAKAAAVNARVAGRMATGWTTALTASRPRPEDADGRVYREAGMPVAEAVCDGELRRFSAVCPHLGGILEWNSGERSWDCPLHGSRFDACGRLLEGPAVNDLTSAPIQRRTEHHPHKKEHAMSTNDGDLSPEVLAQPEFPDDAQPEERDDIPRESLIASRDDQVPETQGESTVDAALDADGQGDLAPEDEDAPTGDAPQDLRTEDR